MSKNARRTAERRRHHAEHAGRRAGPPPAAGATSASTATVVPVAPQSEVWWAWPLRWIAVAAFLGAELVHWTVIDSHRAEWAAAGTFFLVLSVVEAVLTFALIVSLSRWVIVASIVANVVPIAVWAWDRTLGLPFGPDAGRRGQVGRADLVSVILELVAIGALIPFLRSPDLIDQARHGSRRGTYTLAVVGAYVAFVVGYAALGESGRFHDPAGATGATDATDDGDDASTTIATIDAPADVSTGAGDDASGRPALVATQTIDVSMVDFAYELPDTIPAGVTDLRLVNDGAEPHEVIVGRLRADVPEDELPEDVFVEMIFGKSDVLPMGQSGSVAPGDSVDLVVDLGTPGRYVLACNIASPDGSFHYLKGMASIVTVA